MSVIEKSRRGKVVLLYRGDSPKVFCRIKKPDDSGWWRRSTGVTDVARALEIAEEWHDEMRFRDKHGMAFKPAAFSAVCDLYLKELEEEGAIHPSKARRVKDYRPIVDKVSEAIFQGP